MREDHPTVPGETKASSKGNAFSSIQGRLVGLLLLVLVPILVAQAYFSYDRYQSRKESRESRQTSILPGLRQKLSILLCRMFSTRNWRLVSLLRRHRLCPIKKKAEYFSITRLGIRLFGTFFGTILRG